MSKDTEQVTTKRVDLGVGDVVSGFQSERVFSKNENNCYVERAFILCC